MPVSGSGAEYALPPMWLRRSMTRTRLPSWVVTRSATVRPKKPEPTTTRSGLAEVTPRDSTVAAHGRPPTRRRGAPPRVPCVSRPRDDAPLRVVAVTYSPGPTLDVFLD